MEKINFLRCFACSKKDTADCNKETEEKEDVVSGELAILIVCLNFQETKTNQKVYR